VLLSLEATMDASDLTPARAATGGRKRRECGKVLRTRVSRKELTPRRGERSKGFVAGILAAGRMNMQAAARRMEQSRPTPNRFRPNARNG